MESTRLQTAIVKQINRQIKNYQQKTNKELYLSLNHRIQNINMVKDHFKSLEIDVAKKFDAYFENIRRSVEFNKNKFDLSLDYNISEQLFDSYTYPVINNETDDVYDDEIYKNMNKYLFFQGLYPTYEHKNFNNDTFYFVSIFIFVCLTLLSK